MYVRTKRLDWQTSFLTALKKFFSISRRWRSSVTNNSGMNRLSVTAQNGKNFARLDFQNHIEQIQIGHTSDSLKGTSEGPLHDLHVACASRRTDAISSKNVAINAVCTSAVRFKHSIHKSKELLILEDLYISQEEQRLGHPSTPQMKLVNLTSERTLAFVKPFTILTKLATPWTWTIQCLL